MLTYKTTNIRRLTATSVNKHTRSSGSFKVESSTVVVKCKYGIAKHYGDKIVRYSNVY